ncbi:MAG: hypothetical protein JXQ87_14620 [Bacteroidia bacterium]
MNLGQLIQELPNSLAVRRKELAAQLVGKNYNLTLLIPLIYEPEKVSSRFFWLLSDIAELAPEKLIEIQPKLFALRNETTYKNIRHSFSRYWSLYGINAAIEPDALDLLFKWLSDSNSTVSVKVHSMYALEKLVLKYPVIKSELVANIQEQLGKSTASFDKTALKILNRLRD